MLRLGQQEFVAGQFVVMAIVNRTPDSFYDGGANVDLSRALDAAERAVDAGADIVDVGGVRAGYGPPVDAEEELRRVLPVIRGIRQRFGHLVISVDTWRSPVAAEAISARVPTRTASTTPTSWRTSWAPLRTPPSGRSRRACGATASSSTRRTISARTPGTRW